MLSLYYAEGRGHQLLAYRSCSSLNQVPLQRPVMNKEKARGTSWAMIRQSIVLSYSSDKKAGDARTPILLLPRPIFTVRGISIKKSLSLPFIFRCAVNGNPLESGNYSFVCKPLND
ncbi:hypothetical protein PoB_001525400 [Plakobranchus ocellatus]|uniref:Uncharacterized protein n=1 Tax=Plakobranchus ocellatus TaxID=259542 RepID=A0AAV3Z427_9GAST|nr:hypothetical protein PoB_001525400 [Plakobranchus ocellatus]